VADPNVRGNEFCIPWKVGNILFSLATSSVSRRTLFHDDYYVNSILSETIKQNYLTYSQNFICLFNPLEHSGSYMYHTLQHTSTLDSPKRLYVCVLFGFHSELRSLP
jgi:hypothetical protein